MTVRWGIAGPGAIAGGFADDLQHVDDAQLISIGSRSIERAREFADRYDAPNAHGGYEDLANDPEVDVVYVATPQSRHESDVLMFIEAGKHVLCEKPFALGRESAGRMIAAAEAKGTFLMEALWSRFLPSYRRLVELLGDGSLGEPTFVEADFGFALPFDPDHRLYDLELGGGALLDLGVYPVQLASLVLGPPERVSAVGHIGTTGVDERVAAVLGHESGAVGVVKAAISSSLACAARISCTAGVVHLPPMMHCPQQLSVEVFGASDVIETPWVGTGLHFQVAEVHRCLEAGETQSSVMPLAETLSIMGTLDAIREQIGLTFPSGRARNAQRGANL